MARVALTLAEAAICDVVGVADVVAARRVDKDLGQVLWHSDGNLAASEVTTGGHAVVAVLGTSATGEVTGITGECACPDTDCAHVTALCVRVVETDALPLPRPRGAEPAPAGWETTLAAWSTSPDVDNELTVALQVELEDQRTTWPRQRRSETPRPPAPQVRLQPVIPGRNGWIRTGINWSSLSYRGYQYRGRARQHWELMAEIADYTHDGYEYSSSSGRLLNTCGRRIWQLLAEAHDCGLPLIQPGKNAGPVIVGAPVRVEVHADRVKEDLLLTPTAIADGRAIAPEAALPVGNPVHGLVWWAWRDEPLVPTRSRPLRLAPLDPAVTAELLTAAGRRPLRIPTADEPRFIHTYLPQLAGQAPVVAVSDAVELPDLSAVRLVLSLAVIDRQVIARWAWRSPIGDRARTDELWSTPPAAQVDVRAEILDQVTPLVAKAAPELLDGSEIAATRALTGDPMIRALRQLPPALAECADVDVDVPVGRLPLEAEAPVIAFDDAGTGGQDWFDLAVTVTIDGAIVEFGQLFTALGEGREYLLLSNGRYLTLDRPELHQLRELIIESREMTDAPPDTLRVGRLSPAVWQELAELGAISGQAAAWQESIRTLGATGPDVEAAPPAGLDATLRPYQHIGFDWLATRYGHRLGGILADDMGLGKTIQALALILHTRAKDPATPPFLVVAPTSVVSNWAIEAARFAPDLTVASITQTAARRGGTVTEAVGDAHLVVTSYTLLRLEFAEYQQREWAGLILDEAQFVKNPGTQAYRCARDLTAPVKVAITGTPMENHLLDLWALLSITAPGLFPRADRFTEHYRNPIEKERNTERLEQLRRRVRPFLLRRRKEDVATDLPAKQEQVLELELHPRHQKVYQKYLQRERQKVLGLLGDLEQNRFEIFRSLTLLRQASLDVSLVDDAHAKVPSTKLDDLAERVAGLVAEGHRALVFSQFTRFLGAAQSRLSAAGIDVCYLDGKTRNRAKVIQRFKDGAAPVFLISLKAGGFGLNLTEADYCILLDPWWNPAAEAQAVDRIHRIGQARSVMVYRMVAKGTIEEKVMALKARKAELFASVVDGGEFASAQLTEADIRAILE